MSITEYLVWVRHYISIPHKRFKQLIGQTRSLPKCPSTDKWIKKMWYAHHGIILSHKKDEMSFATTWMELDTIILSEVSQLNMRNLKKKRSKWTYLEKRNQLTGTENKLTFTKGKRGGGINLEYEINRYTPTVFKIGKQQGFTYSSISIL